jgi:drug/metabolite transporter (DMT)-like permease
LSHQKDFRAYAALIAVWFFWGTTYLAIRIALESITPLVILSVRFLISGTILMIAARLRGAALPRGRELWLTIVYGLIVLGGGTGSLIFAEQTVPSGLAALLLVTSPFWMIGLEAALGGEKPHLPTIGGILVGCIGVVLLVAPTGADAHFTRNMIPGFLILQFGCLMWCGGSLLQRRQPTKAHPVVSGAVQQLATGLAFIAPALLIPHPATTWTWRSTWALLYLVVFGSIVGYSAFIYIMEHLPVAIVTTYNYVNPVVAMILGWLFYREPFGIKEAAAMLIIFVGVAIVKWTTQKPAAIQQASRATT